MHRDARRRSVLRKASQHRNATQCAETEKAEEGRRALSSSDPTRRLPGLARVNALFLPSSSTHRPLCERTNEVSQQEDSPFT